jgi:ABC-type multidrug transport system fused ATPase/permease subunit
MVCEEVPIQPPGEGEVTVRTRLASICGSDVHTVFPASGRVEGLPRPPGFPGHEAVGEVVESNVPDLPPIGGVRLASMASGLRYKGRDDLLLVEQLDTHEPAGSELSFEQELRLDAVTFTYEGMDRPAVLDADLTIRPGEVIGVCGPRVAARRRSPT